MMKCIGVVLLGLTVASCINIDQTMLTQINERMAPIKESNTGRFIIELATIQSELRGPVDDLVDAISALQDDLQQELSDIDVNYQSKTNDHVRAEQVLELQIGTAETEIANSEDKIDNYLEPTKEQYEKRLEQLSLNIEDNRGALARETLQREDGHEESVSRSQEHIEAIEAIDEAIALVHKLVDSPPSLIQSRSLSNSIKQIEKKLNKNDTFKPMITALLNIAQNFSSQQDVQTILTMLNELRGNTVESLNEETSNEADRQDAWVERQAAILNEYNEFQRQVNDSIVYIAQFKEQIDLENEFVQSRNSDLSTFKESLEIENSTFANETSIYQQARSQLLKEINVSQSAFEFINSADFSNYINSRINVPSI